MGSDNLPAYLEEPAWWIRSEALALLGLLDQAGRRGEPVAVLGGQLLGPGDERLDAGAGRALVAVDELSGTAGERGEPDAEDRADVRLGGRVDHALVEAAGG